MSNAVPDVPDEGQLADRIKGKTKQVVGAVVGDDDLKAEGALQTAKADAAAKARRDADEAARVTAKADIATRQSELRVEQATIAAERAEAAERARLEREEAAAEARIESAAEAQESAVQRQAALQKAAADRKQVSAIRSRLDAEAEAHRIERAAEQARRNAAMLSWPSVRAAGSLVEQITALPRTAVLTALDALRFPLTTVEKLSRQTENEAWPPALLFEEFQAGAKQFAGSLLRDQTLVEAGRVQGAKVVELRRSLELEVEAQQRRAEADEALTEKQHAAERERQRIEQTTREREADVERRAREAKAKAEAEADRAAQEAAQAEQARAERLAETERASRLAGAEVESEALAKQAKAVTSIETVAKLDKAVATKKAKRKNS
jgi:uncharacterized protein YjbJ (UPF0337 family)